MFSRTRTRSSGTSSASRAATGAIANAGSVALRAAEVRAHGDLAGAALEQQPERRQRRADARVVRDAAVLERDVEVGADEDALAGDVGGLDGPRQPHARSFPTRSTSRQL